MPLSRFFKMARLTIEAWEDVERKKPVSIGLTGNRMEAQYNPETLSMRYESVFQGRQGIATSSAQARFAHARSQVLNVNLVFDGTQVGYMGAELLKHRASVAERVQQLLDLCYRIHSASHEPSFLRLSWDKGVLGPGFDCRLQSADITYKGFDRDGSPLHAELACVFVEDLDPKKKAAKDRVSSPDLTHRRVVKAGDTLPLLCAAIYNDPGLYLRVAEFNGLDELRHLEPGQELVFPPLAKGEAS